MVLTLNTFIVIGIRACMAVGMYIVTCKSHMTAQLIVRNCNGLTLNVNEEDGSTTYLWLTAVEPERGYFNHTMCK